MTGLEAVVGQGTTQVLRTNNPAAGQIAHDQARAIHRRRRPARGTWRCWATGNDGHVSTATASSFLNAAGTMGGDDQRADRDGPAGAAGAGAGLPGRVAAGAGPGGNGRGTGLSPRRGSAIRTLAGAWLVRTARFAAINMLPNSGNELLVFRCECSVSDTHRDSAAESGQLPGLPEERMPAGLVLIHGRAHGARIAAQPAEAVGA